MLHEGQDLCRVGRKQRFLSERREGLWRRVRWRNTAVHGWTPEVKDASVSEGVSALRSQCRLGLSRLQEMNTRSDDRFVHGMDFKRIADATQQHDG